MSFINFLNGWQTGKDEEQRRREEEARRKLVLQEQLRRNQDNRIDADLSRRDANKRILNTSKITSQLFGGEPSDAPEKDIGVVSLGLRLRDYNRTQEREKLDAYHEWSAQDYLRGSTERVPSNRNLLGDAWEAVERYGESTSLAGAPIVRGAKRGVRDVFRAPYRVGKDISQGKIPSVGEFLDVAAIPGGPVTIGGRAALRGLASARPSDWDEAINSVLGSDEDREKVRARLEEYSIDEQVIGSVIFDATNLLPGIGFTKADDVVRAFGALRIGGKSLLESKQGMQLIRGLRLLNEAEAGGKQLTEAEKLARAAQGIGPSAWSEPLESPLPEEAVKAFHAVHEYATPADSLADWQRQLFRRLEEQEPVEVLGGFGRGADDVPLSGGPPESFAIVPRAETGWETPEGLRYLTNPTPDNLVEFTATSKMQAEIIGDDASVVAWKKGELLLQKHGEITALIRAENEIDEVIKYGDDAAKLAAQKELTTIRQRLDSIRAELHAGMNALDPPKTVSEEILRNGMIAPEGAFERLWAKAAIKPFISGFTSRFSRANYFANRTGGQILNGAKTELTTQATKLEMELMPAVRQYGNPFKLIDGVEPRTGLHIGDIIEDWDNVGRRFIDDQTMIR